MSSDTEITASGFHSGFGVTFVPVPRMSGIGCWAMFVVLAGPSDVLGFLLGGGTCARACWFKTLRLTWRPTCGSSVQRWQRALGFQYLLRPWVLSMGSVCPSVHAEWATCTDFGQSGGVRSSAPGSVSLAAPL